MRVSFMRNTATTTVVRVAEPRRLALSEPRLYKKKLVWGLSYAGMVWIRIDRTVDRYGSRAGMPRATRAVHRIQARGNAVIMEYAGCGTAACGRTEQLIRMESPSRVLSGMARFYAISINRSACSAAAPRPRGRSGRSWEFRTMNAWMPMQLLAGAR